MAYHADNALPSHSEGERVLPMQKGGKQRLKKSDIWVTGSFDVPFLALSLLLLTIGLVMLFSASYAYAFYNDDGNSYAYISRQLIFAVVGLVAMFILSKLNYKVIQAATVPLLLVTLALLCLVLVYHTNLRGFRRWIPLGPITFQPSDLAKFTISVVLANYISRYYHQMRKFKYGFVYPILVIAVFCGLIYLEHHMSCTILIFLIGASLMWAGGSNWKLFAIGVGIVAAVAVSAYAPGWIKATRRMICAGRPTTPCMPLAPAVCLAPGWAIPSRSTCMCLSRKTTLSFLLYVRNLAL